MNQHRAVNPSSFTANGGAAIPPFWELEALLRNGLCRDRALAFIAAGRSTPLAGIAATSRLADLRMRPASATCH